MTTKRKMITDRKGLKALLVRHEVVSKTRFNQNKNLLEAMFTDKGLIANASTIQRIETDPTPLGEKWRTNQVKYFVGLLAEYVGSNFGT